ncbi:hypothetical protein KJ761_03185 [Patescibacteria group bacterium]|nr:hypothetical protein [Patescibacteria group bacterium]
MEINKKLEDLKFIKFWNNICNHQKNGLDISKYKTTGEFHDAIRASEYSAPLILCGGLDTLMKAKGLTFQEAFKLLLDNKKIILAGKTYIYDLSASKLWEENKIPEGFIKCEVCGEYNGETKMKNLNWGESFIKGSSEEYISVSCLCQGIPCPKCKKNKIHRPISNSYSEEDNSIGHWPYFSGMRACDECRKEK